MKRQKRWIGMLLCVLLICGTFVLPVYADEALIISESVPDETGEDTGGSIPAESYADIIDPVPAESYLDVSDPVPAESYADIIDPAPEEIYADAAAEEIPEEIPAGPETDVAETDEIFSEDSSIEVVIEDEEQQEETEEEQEEEAEEALEEEELEEAALIDVEYRTHVQRIGWEKTWSEAGMNSGTEGQSLRLEGIQIRLKDVGDEYIEYRTHVQRYGWETEWKRNGEASGTTGQSLRLEAIQIRLSPALAEQYDLYYCVHAQTYGWLGWAKNGESAGSEGHAKRLEAIQIRILPKGSEAPEPIGDLEEAFVSYMLRYQTHVQTYGWLDWVTDGETGGTFGQSKRLEGIKIEYSPSEFSKTLSGGVEYRTHIQHLGWETEWKHDGEMSGTTGLSYRLEAIQIRLTGELAEKYDIYYRTHIQTYGWLGWAKNGETSGSEGLSKRMEAMQIVLVPRGGNAPGSTAGTMRKSMDKWSVPYAQPKNGKNTIYNLLRTALVPCGRTLYLWGGGHGPDANPKGMQAQWVDYFIRNATATFEPQYTYISYWDGVDCSGYMGWVLTNTTGDFSEPSALAQYMAKMYSSRGWTYIRGDNSYRPGDIVSVLYGHVWISLGQCSDGSVMLIHSAGNGIQLSGTGGKSDVLADYYMRKYFPYWPYDVIDYDWLLEEDSEVARWITNGSGLLSDPQGMQNMSAEQVLEMLLGD